MTDVIRARNYAHGAHESIKQKRKITGEPYTVHTDAVAKLLEQAGESNITVCAGHLHDVIEDVPSKGFPTHSEQIRDLFGDEVLERVIEVTNVFTKDNYPYLNRNLRKQCEAARLASISPEAQSIKYADIIHNLSDWRKAYDADPVWVVKYAEEKHHALYVMQRGNQKLRKQARVLVDDILRHHIEVTSDNSRHL